MFRYSGPCHQPRGKSLQQVLPSVRPPQLAQLPSQHAAVTHCRAQAQSGPGKPPADDIAQEILTELPRKKQRQPAAAMPQCQEPCFAHLDQSST